MFAGWFLEELWSWFWMCQQSHCQGSTRTADVIMSYIYSTISIKSWLNDLCFVMMIVACRTELFETRHKLIEISICMKILVINLIGWHLDNLWVIKTFGLNIASESYKIVTIMDSCIHHADTCFWYVISLFVAGGFVVFSVGIMLPRTMCWGLRRLDSWSWW